MAMNLGLGADRFKKMATFDEESISTNGTIEIVARWFKEGRFGNEPTYLWHVASANHISRVARDAMKKPFENLPHVTNGFFPAETSYAGGHPSKTDVYDLGDPKI